VVVFWDPTLQMRCPGISMARPVPIDRRTQQGSQKFLLAHCASGAAWSNRRSRMRVYRREHVALTALKIAAQMRVKMDASDRVLPVGAHKFLVGQSHNAKQTQAARLSRRLCRNKDVGPGEARSHLLIFKLETGLQLGPTSLLRHTSFRTHPRATSSTIEWVPTCESFIRVCSPSAAGSNDRL